MADEIETQRLLGRLIEGQDNRTRELGEIRSSIDGLRRALESLSHLPELLANHTSDDRRNFDDLDKKTDRLHAENLNSVVDIRKDIGTLKTERDMRRGAKAFAHALSAAIGALVAVAATLLKLKGAP
jgi:hypothetical protein